MRIENVSMRGVRLTLAAAAILAVGAKFAAAADTPTEASARPVRGAEEPLAAALVPGEMKSAPRRDFAVVYPASATSRFPETLPVLPDDPDTGADAAATSADAVHCGASELDARPLRDAISRQRGGRIATPPWPSGTDRSVPEPAPAPAPAEPPVPEEGESDVETPIGQVRTALETLASLRVGQRRLDDSLAALSSELRVKLAELASRVDAVTAGGGLPCARASETLRSAARGAIWTSLRRAAAAFLRSLNFWKLAAIAAFALLLKGRLRMLARAIRSAVTRLCAPEYVAAEPTASAADEEEPPTASSGGSKRAAGTSGTTTRRKRNP